MSSDILKQILEFSNKVSLSYKVNINNISGHPRVYCCRQSVLVLLLRMQGQIMWIYFKNLGLSFENWIARAQAYTSFLIMDLKGEHTEF